jgi:hypothetical protein
VPTQQQASVPQPGSPSSDHRDVSRHARLFCEVCGTYTFDVGPHRSASATDVPWQTPRVANKTQRAQERHDAGEDGKDTAPSDTSLVLRWRQKEKLKTTAVALVLCLNIGVDPPDVVKISPCARLECWVDPTSLQPAKALEAIGARGGWACVWRGRCGMLHDCRCCVGLTSTLW